MKRSVPSSTLDTFSVFHRGVPMAEGLTLDLVEQIHAWSATGGSETPRLVEVWSSADARHLRSCLAAAVAIGAPVCVPAFLSADDLVADLRVRGVKVRYRHGRRTALDNAEVRAVSSGHVVRYL